MAQISCFFFWLAGADRSILQHCPASERIKFGAIGASLLIPTFTGFGSMYFYAGKHLNSPVAISVIAVIWAFVILTVDRLLLTTYRPFSSFWRKRVWQILLRLVLATFLSTAIAHPICLQQFGGIIKRRHQTRIDEEIAKRMEERTTRLEDIRKQNAALIDPAQQELDSLRSQIDPDLTEREKRVSEKLSLRASTPPELAAVQIRIDTRQKDLAQIEEKLGVDRAEAKRVDDAIYSELNFGWNSYTEGGEIKKKPGGSFSETQRRNKEIAPRMALLYERQAELKKAIDDNADRQKNLVADLDQARPLAMQYQTKTQEVRATAEATVRAELQSEIQLASGQRATQITALEKRLADWRAGEATKRTDADASSSRLLTDLRARLDRSLDPMEETLALADAITRPEHGGESSVLRERAGLFQFALTFGIFLLVDLIPILAKLMSTGPYDEMVHRTEQELREEHDARMSLTGPFVRRRVLDTLGAQTREHLEAIHARDGDVARTNGRAHSVKPPPDLTFERQ